MKRKWMAYIFVPALACLLAVGGMYMMNPDTYANPENREQIYNLDEYFAAEAKRPTEAHTVDEQDVIMEQIPEISNESQAEFILRTVDNYVIVYRADNPEESFMTTGIALDELPAGTQAEILNGKEIMNEEELYFFLESHSS